MKLQPIYTFVVAFYIIKLFAVTEAIGDVGIGLNTNVTAKVDDEKRNATIGVNLTLDADTTRIGNFDIVDGAENTFITEEMYVTNNLRRRKTTPVRRNRNCTSESDVYYDISEGC